MATEYWEMDAGSVWRKAREYWEKDSGGTWRKAKELWEKDSGGTWRKVFSEGEYVNFGGQIWADTFGEVGISAIAQILRDGSLVGTKSAGGSIAINSISGDRWWSAVTADKGDTHWVRATAVSGSTGSLTGSGLGSWLQLSSTRSWSLPSGTGGSVSTRTAEIQLQVASDAAGATIVASGNIQLRAYRES